MTPTAHLVRRLLVAALVLGLLFNVAAGAAAAAAPPPAKKQTPSSPGKKKHKKQHAKKKAKKKKAKKKARARKPAPARPAPRPQPQPTPQPAPQPTPQPTPQPPASQDEPQFDVAASGTYRYLFTTQGPSHSTRAEQNFEWNAAGVASLSRGATDTDFRIATQLLNGFLAKYKYERGSSSGGCASGYAEVPAAGHIPVSVGLAGTSQDNLRASVGDGYFDVIAAETSSGGDGCAALPPRTWTQVFRYSGLPFSVPSFVTGDGSLACAGSGSLASGLFRTCTAIVPRGTAATETWTMSVKLTPTGA